MRQFPIDKIKQVETPIYCYDLNLLKATLEAIKKAVGDSPFIVNYAIKANSNPILTKIIAEHGLGADTVSGGEIKAAMEAGFPAGMIEFAGVGKTDKEIELAIKEGVGCLNVESEEEFDVINEIASKLGIRTNIAIRVNPDIDAHTHHYITTGLEENKFGVSLEKIDGLVEKALKSEWTFLKGLHFHIGSQITILEPYRLLCERVNEIVDHFSRKGITFRTLNMGGGLGVDYDAPDVNPIPDFMSFFDVFRNNLKLQPGQTVHFELGRAIVAQCGTLMSRVLYVKQGVGKKFVIVDAGMTELIRPALYQAHHLIQNLTSTSPKTEKYDVVGPICESSDCFGQDEVLPVTERGDIIAFRSAGAYGESMASQYNCRPLVGSMAF